jgi:hypothetical protein
VLSIGDRDCLDSPHPQPGIACAHEADSAQWIATDSQSDQLPIRLQQPVEAGGYIRCGDLRPADKSKM